jgi:energy-converting hydrogenase Eha subunit B
MANPTPGSGTSEWKATKIIFAIGAVLQAIGAAAGALGATSASALLPDWAKVVLAATPIVAGAAMQISQALGYTRARTKIKIAAIGRNLAADTEEVMLK